MPRERRSQRPGARKEPTARRRPCDDKADKAEWHSRERYPHVGFIVTNLSRPTERVVAFYNQRGTAEPWLKEEKGAVKRARLSCRKFGNFMRTPALPRQVDHWSLTRLWEKPVKIGAKVGCHGRYVTFRMAEVAVPRDLIREILRRSDGVRRSRLATA